MKEWQKKLIETAEENKWSDKEKSSVYMIVALVQADIKEKVRDILDEI